MKTLHSRCAGLDVHKTEVVACLRRVGKRKVEREVRRFPTTTRGLLELGDWLERGGCTHVAMEATGGSQSGTFLKTGLRWFWPTPRM